MAKEKTAEKEPLSMAEAVEAPSMMEVIEEFKHGSTVFKVGEKGTFTESAKLKYKDFLKEVK